MLLITAAGTLGTAPQRAVAIHPSVAALDGPAFAVCSGAGSPSRAIAPPRASSASRIRVTALSYPRSHRRWCRRGPLYTCPAPPAPAATTRRGSPAASVGVERFSPCLPRSGPGGAGSRADASAIPPAGWAGDRHTVSRGTRSAILAGQTQEPSVIAATSYTLPWSSGSCLLPVAGRSTCNNAIVFHQEFIPECRNVRM